MSNKTPSSDSELTVVLIGMASMLLVTVLYIGSVSHRTSYRTCKRTETAIALFDFQAGAALATVVGLLVEALVMLSVVHIVRRSRGWNERGMIR